METATSQAQVDIAQIRDSKPMEELILWQLDYPMINLLSIRAKSCQDLDSISIPKLQERIFSNPRSELKVNTLSPRLTIDLVFLLKKLLLQPQMCTVH